MFNPSIEQVRFFFIEAWGKFNNPRTQLLLSPIELLAIEWIKEHPEYHKVLEDRDSAKKDYNFKELNHNPFLHLSMHLAISEQIMINQPLGIKEAYVKLSEKTNKHKAAHKLIKCLETVMRESNIKKHQINHTRYIELIKITSSI
ncbi:DUF1841 family protein [Candidatus Kinetoplastidibacterium crithidiae]|uniref:DUF1841 family protein n=1 Tax=Candidatus Kinetoplastidibacterium crithidiae TCC036E TaxID=1208918 RepID=M1LX78_9PROT|nr:DUF1841 family protein [Candidatus Kinetoplastibacterium crithidii]AFZ82534.1 hypothetical protein CKCE_0091 [Candidatus Kinetoplastibacterium crithidii (ex Angomonas deanei ATCC 30255)]AGF47804.1 conserved hypothetical protein of the DUF1841 family [Candidatus Kinetoplastibacterium crithidii TCC036E]